MTSEMKSVLLLIHNSVVRKSSSDIPLETKNWPQIYTIARRNNIAPILFDEVVKINNQSPIDEGVMSEWKKITMITSITEYHKSYALRQLLQKIGEEGLHITIFKGPVLADLYPNYALRTSCDTDILIKEEEKEKIFTIVEKLGYHRVEISEDNVYTFENQKYSHRLELHTTLYGQHEGPRIELLNKMELTKPETLISMNACGMSIQTLGYVEQLIYLMFHMIKHFTLEGISLRHLLDIILYINKYIDRISLSRFWGAMYRLGYTSCCKAFFSVGVRYIGLDSRILGDLELEEDKVCEDLLMDVMNHGLKAEENKQIFQLWGMMEPYLVGQTMKKQSLKDNFLTLLKPIDKKYGYARRHKILLPACWVHKIISYIHSKYVLHKGIYTPLEKVRVAENRIQLLQEVGLIEKSK